ncbi:MAG TPA: hypothetical protein VH370_19550, partial [Humisphaera sp.]|nr:hypothetical protein [Humisphaera sp.]
MHRASVGPDAGKSALDFCDTCNLRRVSVGPDAGKSTLDFSHTRNPRRVAVGPKVHLPALQFLAILLASLSFTLLQGCDHFGTGGTGEMVVPPERFHQVQSTEFPVASTQPSTNPTTNPTVENPPPELVLSLQECRAIALQNNLDLKVSLYQPAISYTSVTEEQAAFEAVFGASASYQHNVQPA